MSQGDIVVLGIKVESGEAVSAADDFAKLAKAGERAEVAMGGISLPTRAVICGRTPQPSNRRTR